MASCVGGVSGGVATKKRTRLGGNRVSAKVEIAGLDMPEMGGLGYPEYIKHILPEDISDAQVASIKAGNSLEPTSV